MEVGWPIVKANYFSMHKIRKIEKNKRFQKIIQSFQIYKNNASLRIHFST